MAATGFPAFLSLFLMHCISYMSTIIFGQVLILFFFAALSPFCPTVVLFVGGFWYCLFSSQFFHSASHLSCGQDVRRALKTFAHLIGVLFTFRRCSCLSCGRAANGLKIPLLLHQQVSWVCPCFSPHLERHVFLQRNRTIAKNFDNQNYSFFRIIWLSSRPLALFPKYVCISQSTKPVIGYISIKGPPS